jgi:hypothetical protein
MRYSELRSLSALAAYPSGGPASAIVLPQANPGAGGPGVTLGVGTFYFPLGGERAGAVVETAMHSFSAMWPLGIVGTLTIEGTNFPKTLLSTDQGPGDVNDWDATAGWQQINPALTGMVLAVASGTGVMTNFSCAVASGIGGAFWNIPDLGAMRLRLKAALTTGGLLRVFGHSKLGS